MAFFPRNYYGSSDAGFHPLFRLLDDFDTYSREGGRNSGLRGRAAAPFEPKFDVREVGNDYVLHGELPGLDKKDVSIEFTDAHNLRIHGRIERSYTLGTPPAAVEQKETGAITEGEEQPAAEQPEKAEEAKDTAHQPTIEDEGAEANSTAAPKPDTTVAETPKKRAPARADPFNGDKAKYWVSERTVGEFSRTFNFPAQIQRDNVSATLKDGILTVTIPKAPKYEARRIEIS